MNRQLLPLVLVGVLAACAGPGPDNPLERPRANVAPQARSLPERPVLQPVQGVTDNLIKTIESYWLLLEALPDRELEPLVLRRLGDLLVQQGEQSLQDIDRLAAAEAPILGEQALASDARLQAMYQLSEDSHKGAVSVYDQLVEVYPRHPLSAEALYQKARAHESLGQPELALASLGRLSRAFPDYPRRAEVDFRRGELLFQAERFADASRAYAAVIAASPRGPFRNQALYKRGWAEFKDKGYDSALAAFFELLDTYLSGKENGTRTLAGLNPGLREQLEDTLRAAYLSFSYQDGVTSVGRFLDRTGGRSYEDLIYRRLGEYYLEQQRFTESAEAFLAYGARHPASDDAPRFHILAIGAYEAGGFGQRTREAKESFATNYAVDQPFWRNRDRTPLQGVIDQLRQVRAELARYHHARAQRAAKSDQPKVAATANAEFERAQSWYRAFLADPGEGAAAAEVVFLYAELLYQRDRPAEAVDVYERAAYDFGAHPKAAESAYAAMLAYDAAESNLPEDQRNAWQRRTTSSARRFASRFPGHPQLPAVLTRAAQAELRLGNLAAAESVARKVVEARPEAEPGLRQIAWTLIGHSAFELGQFARAETAYQQALVFTPPEHVNYRPIRDRLAASIYQQGAQAREQERLAEAAELFRRVGQTVPEASIRATADYDAAAAFIATESWVPAIAMLKGFQTRFADHELAADVGIKLALALDRSGQGADAAAQYEVLGRQTGRPADLRREMLRTAAELYRKAGDGAGQKRVWAYYLGQFPQPLAPAQEARWTLAGLAEAEQDTARQRRWLAELVDAQRRSGESGDARLRYLAAQSTWLLAQRRLEQFESVRLVAPLQRNLARKRERMQAALAELGRAAEYGVAEVVTVATFQIADVYRRFGRALMASERPSDLNQLELEQYTLLLEEQAFPFEEKAIDLHELNLGRIRNGVYDEWVEKSRAELAELLPVRYARPERALDYVDRLR